MKSFDVSNFERKLETPDGTYLRYDVSREKYKSLILVAWRLNSSLKWDVSELWEEFQIEGGFVCLKTRESNVFGMPRDVVDFLLKSRDPDIIVIEVILHR